MQRFQSCELLTNANFVSGPLGSKRLAQLHDSRLGSIVTTLLLWPIDNMRRHGSDEDDRTSGSLFDHFLSGRLCTDECTSEIDVDQTTELADIVGFRRDIGASEEHVSNLSKVQSAGENPLCNTCRADENINASKILSDLLAGNQC